MGFKKRFFSCLNLQINGTKILNFDQKQTNILLQLCYCFKYHEQYNYKCKHNKISTTFHRGSSLNTYKENYFFTHFIHMYMYIYAPYFYKNVLIFCVCVCLCLSMSSKIHKKNIKLWFLSYKCDIFHNHFNVDMRFFTDEILILFT